jgi:hypothetical protein
MPATATSVVVVIILFIIVYLVFEAVTRGVPKNKNYEVEVGLFPPKIRRKITDSDRESKRDKDDSDDSPGGG